jgi:threonyl-tRNA synthetase
MLHYILQKGDIIRNTTSKNVKKILIEKGYIEIGTINGWNISFNWNWYKE